MNRKHVLSKKCWCGPRVRKPQVKPFSSIEFMKGFDPVAEREQSLKRPFFPFNLGAAIFEPGAIKP